MNAARTSPRKAQPSQSTDLHVQSVLTRTRAYNMSKLTGEGGVCCRQIDRAGPLVTGPGMVPNDMQKDLKALCSSLS
jgi:hypothetical protein